MSIKARVWTRDKNGKLRESEKTLGSRQVETLLSFKGESLFEPTRSGKPWAEMIRLNDLGLMFIHREKVSTFGFDGAGWSEDRWQCRAGLTEWGRAYVDAVKHKGPQS